MVNQTISSACSATMFATACMPTTRRIAFSSEKPLRLWMKAACSTRMCVALSATIFSSRLCGALRFGLKQRLVRASSTMP